MQAIINIKLEKALELPINYNHILQAILYNAISAMPHYMEFLHDIGFSNGQQSFKMFNFSQLRGRYEVKDKKICFMDKVSFDVRSPDALMIHIISRYLSYYGVTFGDYTYQDVHTKISDFTVESEELHIKMLTPTIVFDKDLETGFKYFYSPYDEEFYSLIQENFVHKYEAFYDVTPSSLIQLELCGDKEPRKIVTKYQGTMLNGWYGEYIMRGERKYLDFLYQTGLGARNSQGFGMFKILKDSI